MNGLQCRTQWSTVQVIYWFAWALGSFLQPCCAGFMPDARLCAAAPMNLENVVKAQCFAEARRRTLALPPTQSGRAYRLKESAAVCRALQPRFHSDR